MQNASSFPTILLVEDQDQLRALARRILERNGFRVLAVADAHAALTTLDQRGAEINILLSDVIMPDVDGVHLAREVRARFPAIKIILMTGSGAVGVDGTSVVDDLVLKPFTAESLVTAARHAT